MQKMTNITINGKKYAITAIPGAGAPTQATEGAVGQFYMDTDNGDLYKCVAENDGVYTWEPVGGGSVETDKTLSLPNVPADAKAVAERISHRYISACNKVDDSNKRIAKLEGELFAFFVDGYIFNAARGMCWEDWLYSDYNYAGFLIDDNDCVLDQNCDPVVKKNDSNPVGIGSAIIPFGIYTIL